MLLSQALTPLSEKRGRQPIELDDADVDAFGSRVVEASADTERKPLTIPTFAAGTTRSAKQAMSKRCHLSQHDDCIEVRPGSYGRLAPSLYCPPKSPTIPILGVDVPRNAGLPSHRCCSLSDIQYRKSPENFGFWRVLGP